MDMVVHVGGEPGGVGEGVRARKEEGGDVGLVKRRAPVLGDAVRKCRARGDDDRWREKEGG